MSEKKHTIGDLRQMQSFPLEAKIRMTEYRIREWYEAWDGQVYVSFSGGKDSTVLLDIARKIYPDIEAVFVDTGLEYVSVRKFATSQDNVTVLKPKMNFRDVICKYGYPIFSKQICKKAREAKRGSKIAMNNFNGEMKGSLYDFSFYRFVLNAPFLISEKCCNVMKKKSLKGIGKYPIIGSMAEESTNRKKNWLKFGCNAFDMKYYQSNPISFWTENDVLQYIHENNLPIAEAYGEVIVKGTEHGQMCIADMLRDYRDCQFSTTGCKRTGCIFCLFGIRQDLKRILNLQKIEPKRADYVLRGGEFNYTIFDKNETEIKLKHCSKKQIEERCENNSNNSNFNVKAAWQPDNRGLGYWFVLDWLALHGIVVPYENAEHYREAYGNERTRDLLKGGK